MEDNVGKNIATIIAVFITALALSWAANTFRVPTFAERFQPAIDHPLKQMSYARNGYCFPRKCRVV